ncbi:hypothetical protein B0H11DRAFT_1979550 [Mycena galericulata]|nr:hypothetical protein B0H11DRAFT_1979550 [Mycena galericulata]
MRWHGLFIPTKVIQSVDILGNMALALPTSSCALSMSDTDHPPPSEPTPRLVWSEVRHTKDANLKPRITAIFQYCRDVCFPQVVEWENRKEAASKQEKKDMGARKDYILQTIYPKIDEAFFISGPDGFKIEDFQKWLVEAIKNFVRVAKSNDGVLSSAKPVASETAALVPTSAKPAKQPAMRRKSAKDVLAAEKKVEVSMLSKKKLEGLERKKKDGLELTMHNQAVDELWNQCTDEQREELETKAAELNADMKKPPTEADLIRNQDNVGERIHDSLRRLAGFGPKQAGDIVYFVRYAFIRPDESFRSMKISVVPNPTAAKRFPDTNEEAGDEFRRWAQAQLRPGKSEDDKLETPDDKLETPLKSSEVQDANTPSRDQAPPPTSTTDQVVVPVLEKDLGEGDKLEKEFDFSPATVKVVAAQTGTSVASFVESFFGQRPAPPANSSIFGQHPAPPANSSIFGLQLPAPPPPVNLSAIENLTALPPHTDASVMDELPAPLLPINTNTGTPPAPPAPPSGTTTSVVDKVPTPAPPANSSAETPTPPPRTNISVVNELPAPPLPINTSEPTPPTPQQPAARRGRPAKGTATAKPAKAKAPAANSAAKKRKTPDTAAEAQPAAKKSKPQTEGPTRGLSTRSKAPLPSSSAREPQEGRQIGRHFYFKGASLPKGYSWDDAYTVEYA